jgi:hypothetical protein
MAYPQLTHVLLSRRAWFPFLTAKWHSSHLAGHATSTTLFVGAKLAGHVRPLHHAHACPALPNSPLIWHELAFHSSLPHQPLELHSFSDHLVHDDLHYPLSPHQSSSWDASRLTLSWTFPLRILRLFSGAIDTTFKSMKIEQLRGSCDEP